MKGIQCYELFGGIALKNHAFLFFHIYIYNVDNVYDIHIIHVKKYIYVNIYII